MFLIKSFYKDTKVVIIICKSNYVVEPIVLLRYEVWGFRNDYIVEKVHLKC